MLRQQGTPSDMGGEETTSRRNQTAKRSGTCIQGEKNNKKKRDPRAEKAAKERERVELDQIRQV